MFGAIMGIALTAVLILLELFALFSRAFLERITVVNSIVLAAAGGITLYLCNRNFDAFFSFKIHPAICLVIGIALFFLFYFLQTTKVGFWIFAVLFSIVWAFLTALILRIFIESMDMVWFWVVFGISFFINIGSHLRSRDETEFSLG